MNVDESNKNEPVVKSEENLPEITIKAVVLSIFLIIILAASNAYLGLKVGTTISASIPAVVIAMGVFRLFRRHSVLEINIAQTAASVGEGITAGLIFTIPALVILHFWTGFNYWETSIIGSLGGVAGVLFSVPLRRALLEDKTLKFPEGTAIGQVMKVTASGGGDIKPIVSGGFVGAAIAFCQTGLQVMTQGYDFWFIKGKMILGCGLGFSPAVIAAGYICGINVGISIFIGIVLGWIIGVPVLSWHFGFAASVDPVTTANQIWSHYIRYIGVGTMLVGGLWTLIKLFRPVTKAICSSFEALHHIRQGKAHKILRIDRDIPINYIFWVSILIAIGISAFLISTISPAMIGVSSRVYIIVLLICVTFFFVAGFVLSSVSGYFAGLVGATNSPGSGLLVSAILLLSFILLFFIGHFVDFSVSHAVSLTVAGLAVMICSFIGSALVMTNESIQVAKAGDIIGGTPWKQQVILIGGVFVAAFTIPLILSLLFQAYGIGGVFPREGMAASQMLAAPQAGLIAAVAQAVFNHQLPWNMMLIGCVIAVIGICIDEFIKVRFEKRLPVLAVGLGIYLPLSASVPIVIGGIISYFVQRKIHARYGLVANGDDIHESKGMQNALFLACGLVAGSTLMGVILAIPFALAKNSDVLRIMPDSLMGVAGIIALVVTATLCYWLYRVGVKHHEAKA